MQAKACERMCYENENKQANIRPDFIFNIVSLFLCAGVTLCVSIYLSYLSQLVSAYGEHNTNTHSWCGPQHEAMSSHSLPPFFSSLSSATSQQQPQPQPHHHHRHRPSSSSSSSSSSSWLNTPFPLLTRDQKAYVTELSQRRRHVPAVVDDLSEIREHEVNIQHELRICEQRLRTLSRKLNKVQALLRDVTNEQAKKNAHKETDYDTEIGRLKSSVRLLEMDIDDVKVKEYQERRALKEVMRRGTDIKDDLHREWKIVRMMRDNKKAKYRFYGDEQVMDEEEEEEREKVESNGRPVLSCPVCLEEIVRENDDAMALPCGHVFHDECVSAWLKRKQTCPTCQIPVLWHT